LLIAGVICSAGLGVLVLFGMTVVVVWKLSFARIGDGTNTAASDRQEEPANAAQEGPASVQDQVGVTPDATNPEFDLKTLPSWIPVYPNLLKPARGLQQEEKGVASGTTTVETDDSLEKVKEFYESMLKADGFETTVDQTTTRSSESAQITARKEDGKRTLHAAIRQEKERTAVTLSYEDAGSGAAQ
jgi:uncharacterized iron-regulated membrane protein